MRIIDRLIQAIRTSAAHNPDANAPPACILWTDKDRQWEPIIPRLLMEIPELLVLGPFAPDKRTGPAIWLRCAMVGKGGEFCFPNQSIPVLYLPGFGRQDLRAVEECPDAIKPLAELQYRGTIWSQVNAKDWTILSFLKSDQGGLGLDVAMDQSSRNAMLMALYRILDEDIELLECKRLDKEYFNALLAGGDHIRDLLQWLDHADAFRAEKDGNSWIGFVEVCKSRLGFNPDNDGVLIGASRLAAHDGSWSVVWNRFCEAPRRYPHIPSLIRKTSLPMVLFAELSGWPQHNEQEECSLRGDLLQIGEWPPHKARKRIHELESKHGERRAWVWADLEEAPLAVALEHLHMVANVTGTMLASGNPEEMAASYLSHGWRADDAMLRALSCVRTEEDYAALRGVIRAIYLPWIETSAQYLQKVVYEAGYPGMFRCKQPCHATSGECVLFVDGLRFDVAKRLSQQLTNSGLSVQESPRWSALPSVTATGKAAVTPVQHLLAGHENQVDFEPCITATGQSLKGGYHLRKLLEEDGWQILDRGSTGDPKGLSWCEFGDMDHEGHDRGWKLVRNRSGQ